MMERLERRLIKLEAAQAPKPQAKRIDLSKLSDDLIIRLADSRSRLDTASDADIAELRAAGFELEGDAP